MKLAVYYHDAYLPYSRYFLEGLLQSREFEEVMILGPKATAENSIFNQGETLADPRLHLIKSSRLNWKWMRPGAVRKILAKFKPDAFLILDEALSWNVLVGSLTARFVLGKNCVCLFYAFENLRQSPPVRWFLEKPGPDRLIKLLKKILRAFLFEWALMPARKALNPHGLYAYPECREVILKHGWKPEMQEAWFPVDTKKFTEKPLPEDRDSLKKKYGIGKETKVLTFAGRFIKEKGISGLIQSLPLFKQPVMLLLAGSGPEEETLRKLARDLGIDDKVRFVGPLDSLQLRLHLGITDVLVLPSLTGMFWKEQLGRILLEAMTAGVNVAGSASGAIPYVIGREEAIFREDDPEGIVLAATNVLESPWSPQRLQERAAAASVERFCKTIKDAVQA